MLKSIVVSSLLLATAFTISNASEARTAYVEAPWKSSGVLMMTSEKTAKFMGVFQGVLVVETDAAEELKALPFVCPSTQKIDMKNKTVITEGDCLIGTQSEDVIYASFICKGPLDGCKGKFSLKGGTGKFQGISGGSFMEAQAVVQSLTLEGSGQFAAKEATGALIMPDLTYKIPEKK